MATIIKSEKFTMKKWHLFIASVLIIFTHTKTEGQTNTNNEFIITSGLDTIRNIRILKSRSKTNENSIAYIDHAKKERKLKAEQVKSYFTENRKYFSEILEDGSCKFINYQAEGYLNFGESFSSIGKYSYYLKKNNEIVSLENHNKNLQGFLISYLEDFINFYAGYNKQILYEFKSLAEFTSAYNVYKFPKQYLFVEYKNKEKSSIGLMANYGFYKIDMAGLQRENQKNISPSLGLDLVIKYHRNGSLHLPILFNYTINTSDLSDIYLTSLNFEPTLEFNIFQKKQFIVSIFGGLGLQYQISSHLEQASGTTEIKGFNVGYQLGISSRISKGIVLTCAYVNYNLSTEPINPQSIDDSRAKGNMHGLKIGIGFY